MLGGSVRTGIGQSPWFGEGGEVEEERAGSALGVGRGLPGGSDDRTVFHGRRCRGGGDDASGIAAGSEIGKHAGAQRFGLQPARDCVRRIDLDPEPGGLRADLRDLSRFCSHSVGGHGTGRSIGRRSGSFWRERDRWQCGQ